MTDSMLHAVTGATGFSGKYITRRLLFEGKQVITLTNSPNRPNPFGDSIALKPLAFHDPDRLTQFLEGVDVLYNTYWVRFNHRQFRHADAIDNTLALFEAAKSAGVRRVVHISITNPKLNSPLEYFRGKAILEKALIESGLSYAILRPAVIFGREDILINNLAWTLRKLPVFGVFGNGSYRLQPIYVDDLAQIAVEQGKRTENIHINAIGPEDFTFRGLVEEVGRIIGKSRLIVPMPPVLGFMVVSVLGLALGDVMITWDEIKGLMGNLLHVDTPPTGSVRLTEWAAENADSLGARYSSELARRVKGARRPQGQGQ